MKRFMLAAVAALAMVSCSQSEDFDAAQSGSEINFNTAVTRGTVLVTNDFTKFKAYGYAHTEAFSTTIVGEEIMNGTFNKVESNWSEAEGKKFYWPLTGKVTFFGYSPATDGTYSYASPGYPTIAYKVNEAIASQVDFVVATVSDQEKAASVSLPFKHALTQVEFKLKGNDATVNYSVSKVILKGVKDEGTYNFGTKSWDVSADDTTVDYTITLGTPVAFKGGDPATALTAADQLLIVMPQELTAATVEVTYSATKGITPLFNGTHKASLTATWAVGERNTYTLALQAGDEIKVSGTLEDTWTPKESDVPVIGY